MGFLLILLSFCGAFLVFPTIAYAWGPATHLQIGIEILKNIYILKETLRDLLLQFPYAYLYGCIGADIIFAKGLAKLHEHSHSWLVGLGVLEEASTSSQQAFAYGYLSHLAADIIAHNHYIPEQVIKSFSTKTLRHLYWEIRFDTFAKKESWTLAMDVASISFPENDELLERVVSRTLFSFKTDKKIFHSLLVLNRMKQWQKMLLNLSEKSPWKLFPGEVEHYNRLSLESSLDFLTNQNMALCVKKDPIGRDALHSAKWIRKNLKTLNKKGRLTPQLYSQVINSFQSNSPSARSSMFDQRYLGESDRLED